MILTGMKVSLSIHPLGGQAFPQECQELRECDFGWMRSNYKIIYKDLPRFCQITFIYVMKSLRGSFLLTAATADEMDLLITFAPILYMTIVGNHGHGSRFLVL